MGNQNSSNIDLEDNDLPPKFNASELSDREFVDRYMVLANHDATPCVKLAQLGYSINRDNVTTQEGLYMIDLYLGLCFYHYLDRDLHQCLTENNVTIENMTTEVHYMASQYKDKKITTEEANERKFVAAAANCIDRFPENEKVLLTKQQLLADNERLKEIYKDLEDRAKTGTNVVTALDSRESMIRKHQKASIACQQYQPKQPVSIRNENVVNRQMAYMNYGRCISADLCAKDIQNCIARDPENMNALKCVFYDEKTIECQANIILGMQ